PCGPLGARLKESARTDYRHSTWRALLVSTRSGRTPALDAPSLELDRDPPRLHHETSRGQGGHDFLHPLAFPDDEIGAAARGAAVVAEIENPCRVRRHGGHEVPQVLGRSH